MRPFTPRLLILAATTVLLPAPPAEAGLTVTPGALFTVDCVMPDSPGPYHIVQYDELGNAAGSLLLVDPVGIGIPTGVALLGGDLFVSGTVAGGELVTSNEERVYHP